MGPPLILGSCPFCPPGQASGFLLSARLICHLDLTTWCPSGATHGQAVGDGLHTIGAWFPSPSQDLGGRLGKGQPPRTSRVLPSKRNATLSLKRDRARADVSGERHSSLGNWPQFSRKQVPCLFVARITFHCRLAGSQQAAGIPALERHAWWAFSAAGLGCVWP